MQRVCWSTVSQDVLCTKRMINFRRLRLEPMAVSKPLLWTLWWFIVSKMYHVFCFSMKTKLVLFCGETCGWNMRIFLQSTYIVVLQFCDTQKCPMAAMHIGLPFLHGACCWFAGPIKKYAAYQKSNKIKHFPSPSPCLIRMHIPNHQYPVSQTSCKRC